MKTKPFAEAVISSLREYCLRHYGGNMRAFSAFLGIDPDSGVVSRWMRSTGAGPTLAKIGPAMDKLGVTLTTANKADEKPFEMKIQLAKGLPLTTLNEALEEVLVLRKENARLKEELDAYKAIVMNMSKLLGQDNTINITNNNNITK